MEAAAQFTPRGATREGILRALDLPLDRGEQTARETLGNGIQVTAPDTVPFCLWCASAHLDNYAEALWATVRVDGDMDTNCAIVGGIVALANPHDGIPDSWSCSREGLWIQSSESRL